ncbi:hypothetical protein HPB47_025446, partial [Ixodes persulcatus]
YVRELSMTIFVGLPKGRSDCQVSSCYQVCKRAKPSFILLRAVCKGNDCQCALKSPCTFQKCVNKCTSNRNQGVKNAACVKNNCVCTYEEPCTPEFCTNLCMNQHPEKVLLGVACDRHGCLCTFR